MVGFLSVTWDTIFRELVTKAVDDETAATSCGFVAWDLSYGYPGEETVWSSPQRQGPSTNFDFTGWHRSVSQPRIHGPDPDVGWG